MSEYRPLYEQFDDIIRPRLNRVNNEAAKPVAEAVDKQMKENTEAGRGFGDDQYDSQYSESHVKERKRLGYQTGNVDLRMGNRRIENTEVSQVGGERPGVKIRFNQGGRIFGYHHTGDAKGGKVRSIFPKTPESVPDDIYNMAKRIVGEVLKGQRGQQ